MEPPFAHKHAVYIASPFFNEKQMNNVKFIEDCLDENGVTYYSPRRSGISFKDLSPEDREKLSYKVFRDNVDNINDSLFVLACVDDRDTGTSWEIGYAFGTFKPIVTFSGEGYGVNVMLAKSTKLHLDSLDKAALFIKGFGLKAKEQNEEWLEENIEIIRSMINNSELTTNE